MKLGPEGLAHFRCSSTRSATRRYFSAASIQLVERDAGQVLDFQGKGEGRQADRDLLLDVLSSSATKRDAKSFLSRYQAKSKATAAGSSDVKQLLSQNLRRTAAYNEVNLGNLFSSSRIASAELMSEPYLQQLAPKQEHALRAAVIIIRSISSIDGSTLAGIGHTIAQLSRLGLGCVVIIDDDLPPDSDVSSSFSCQLERLVDCVETDGTVRAQRLNRLFQSAGPQGPWATSVKVTNLDRVFRALQHESVVVAAPVVYGKSGGITGANANGAALSLSRELQHAKGADLTHGKDSKNLIDTSPAVSLDRVIVIDPRGGIPKISQGGSHVFINLEQEFESISKGLQTLAQEREDISTTGSVLRTDPTTSIEAIGESERISAAAATLSAKDIRAHLSNLRLTRGILSSLPSTSSSLIVTPAAASYSTNTPVQGVGTRSQRNPLIHNLLTDKPLFSSSLPRGRLSAFDTDNIPTNHPSMIDAPPTHLKHGMPLVIVPDPSSRAWKAPDEATFSLSLEDPRIDIKRLVALIEDSFGRSLDAEAYFARIRPRLAGIIVAGNYEGGAILTWEQPKSFHQRDACEVGLEKSQHLVPYLDKFAVLRQAQGGGVADVVFSAMVRRCFPKGVCWRSRNGNPVNKWYFERSKGAYKLPLQRPGDQAWTMFWTTHDLQGSRFAEYAEVCLAVKSSWADDKDKRRNPPGQ